MLRYVIALLLLGLAFGQRHALKYQDCGTKAKIKQVEVEPCNSEPCVFKRGNESKIHFTIIADQDSATATLKAKLKTWYGRIPVTSLKSDLCSLAVKCPIKKGQEYSGTLTVLIPRYVFPMITDVDLEIRLDHGVSVCTKAKAKIV